MAQCGYYLGDDDYTYQQTELETVETAPSSFLTPGRVTYIGPTAPVYQPLQPQTRYGLVGLIQDFFRPKVTPTPLPPAKPLPRKTAEENFQINFALAQAKRLREEASAGRAEAKNMVTNEKAFSAAMKTAQTEIRKTLASIQKGVAGNLEETVSKYQGQLEELRNYVNSLRQVRAAQEKAYRDAANKEWQASEFEVAAKSVISRPEALRLSDQPSRLLRPAEQVPMKPGNILVPYEEAEQPLPGMKEGEVASLFEADIYDPQLRVLQDQIIKCSSDPACPSNRKNELIEAMIQVQKKHSAAVKRDMLWWKEQFRLRGGEAASKRPPVAFSPAPRAVRRLY